MVLLSQAQRRDVTCAVRKFAEVWAEGNIKPPTAVVAVSSESGAVGYSTKSKAAMSSGSGQAPSAGAAVVGVSCINDLRQVLFEALGGNLVGRQDDDPDDEGDDQQDGVNSEFSTSESTPGGSSTTAGGRSGVSQRRRSRAGSSRADGPASEGGTMTGDVLKPRRPNQNPQSSSKSGKAASSIGSGASSNFRTAAEDAEALAQQEQEEEERLQFFAELSKAEQEDFLQNIEGTIDALLKTLLYFEVEDPYPGWYLDRLTRLEAIEKLPLEQQRGLRNRLSTCPTTEPLLNLDEWLLCLDPRQNKGGSNSPAGKLAYHRLRFRFSRLQLERISHWLLEILFEQTTTVHWPDLFRDRCKGLEELPSVAVEELVFFLSRIISPRAFKADSLLPLVEVGKLRALNQPEAVFIDVKRMCSILSEAQAAMLVSMLQQAEQHLELLEQQQEALRSQPKIRLGGTVTNTPTDIGRSSVVKSTSLSVSTKVEGAKGSDDFMSKAHLSEIDKLSAAFGLPCPHNSYIRRFATLCFPEHLESHQLEIARVLCHHIVMGSPNQQGISGTSVTLRARLALWANHLAFYCGSNLFTVAPPPVIKRGLGPKRSLANAGSETREAGGGPHDQPPPRANYRRMFSRRTLAFRAATNCANCLNRDLVAALGHQLGLVSLHGLSVLSQPSTALGEVTTDSLGEMAFNPQVSSLVSAAHAIVRKAFPDAPESLVRLVRFLLLEGATFPSLGSQLGMDQLPMTEKLLSGGVSEEATTSTSSQAKILQRIPATLSNPSSSRKMDGAKSSASNAFDFFATVLRRMQFASDQREDVDVCRDFLVGLTVQHSKSAQLLPILEALPKTVGMLDPKQSLESISQHGLDAALLLAAEGACRQWNGENSENEEAVRTVKRESLPEVRWTMIKVGKRTTSYGTPVPMYDVSAVYECFIKRLTSPSATRGDLNESTPQLAIASFFAEKSTKASVAVAAPKKLSVEAQHKQAVAECVEQSRLGAGIMGVDIAAVPYSAAMLQYEFELYPRGHDGGILLPNVLQTIEAAAVCQADERLCKKIQQYAKEKASIQAVAKGDVEFKSLSPSPPGSRKAHKPVASSCDTQSIPTVSFDVFSSVMLQLARL